MKIYKNVIKELTLILFQTVSWFLSPVFMIIHIIFDNCTPNGQYFIYRPLFIKIDDNNPKWFFRVLVIRTGHIIGSGPETMETWFTYSSIKEHIK